MTRNGRAYRQRLWEPATEGTGGGLLPTPRVQPGNFSTVNGKRYETSLQSMARRGLLPTPSACVANDGERPETWLARRERVKLTAKNGNGMGMPLTIAAQLLPTPRANDAEKRGNFDPTNPRNGLPVAVKLLPTPNAGEAKQSGNVQNWQRRQLEHAATGQDLQIPLAVAVKLLPTSTTNDSKSASLPPSQQDRDGLAGAMLRDDSIPTGAATYLNPSFVEEMMGYPVGWTA